MQRDVQYLVRDGEVKIIDRATGRVQPISRWTDGIHSARPPLLPAWRACPHACTGRVMLTQVPQRISAFVEVLAPHACRIVEEI